MNLFQMKIGYLDRPDSDRRYESGTTFDRTYGAMTVRNPRTREPKNKEVNIMKHEIRKRG